jgi:lysozyme
MKQPSQLLFDLIEAFEGCELSAYQDSAEIWTIGWGTVYYPDGSTVKEGDTCTKEQAQQYLLFHLKGVIGIVNTTVPTILTQAQFDAVCDFVYNVGEGAWSNSTLKKQINTNSTDYASVSIDFGMWNKTHSGGKVIEVPGLTRRRKSEAYLYQYGHNHPTFFQ